MFSYGKCHCSLYIRIDSERESRKKNLSPTTVWQLGFGECVHICVCGVLCELWCVVCRGRSKTSSRGLKQSDSLLICLHFPRCLLVTKQFRSVTRQIACFFLLFPLFTFVFFFYYMLLACEFRLRAKKFTLNRIKNQFSCLTLWLLVPRTPQSFPNQSFCLAAKDLHNIFSQVKLQPKDNNNISFSSIFNNLLYLLVFNHKNKSIIIIIVIDNRTI